MDYQRVLDSQRFLTDLQDVWTATRGDAIVNLVAMYKALGGGWQIREGEDFIPADTKDAMRERTNWGDLLGQAFTQGVFSQVSLPRHLSRSTTTIPSVALLDMAPAGQTAMQTGDSHW